MGLGKTIQTAVLLQMAWNEGTARSPAIIVVPLSTICEHASEPPPFSLLCKAFCLG